MTDVSRSASPRQLGVGDDERLEPEGPEWATVVGHDRDDRPGVALGVDGREVAQRPAAQLGGLGKGELDRGYRVVLVRGRLARSPRRPVPDGRGVRARPEVISVRNELGVARPAAPYLANELHRGECVAAEPCSGLAAPFVSPPP